jgi:hypothetical protein
LHIAALLAFLYYLADLWVHVASPIISLLQSEVFTTLTSHVHNVRHICPHIVKELILWIARKLL